MEKEPYTVSDKALKQRQNAAKKHGMYVLERHGESALSETGKTRLQELKEQLATEPGRIAYKHELAAFLALMCEVGFSNIREIVETKGNIWDSSPVGRMGVYVNSLIRLLDSFPKETGTQDITTVLQGVMNDKATD